MKNSVVVETSYLRKGKYLNSGKFRFVSFLFGLIVIAATLLAAYNLKTKFESQVVSYNYFELFPKAVNTFLNNEEAKQSELLSFNYLNSLGLLGLTLFVILFTSLFTTFTKKSKFYFNHYKLYRFFRIINFINLILIIFLQFYTKVVDLELLPLSSIDGRGFPSNEEFGTVFVENVKRLYEEDSQMFILKNVLFVVFIIPIIVSFVMVIVRTVIQFHYAYATFAPLLVLNLFVYVHLIARRAYVYRFENYNEDYYQIKKIENKSVYNIINKIFVYGIIIPAVLAGAVWLNHKRSVPALDKILFRVQGYDVYKSHLLGILYGYLISGTVTLFIYYRYYYGELYIKSMEDELENKEDVLATEDAKYKKSRAYRKAQKKALEEAKEAALAKNAEEEKAEEKTGDFYTDVILKNKKEDSDSNNDEPKPIKVRKKREKSITE